MGTYCHPDEGRGYTSRTLLRIASALFGLAIAVALVPHFAAAPAPPHQLPGYATAHGVDAQAPFRFYLAVVALTILVPLLLRPLFARLRPGIAIASWAGALWFATVDASPLWVIAIGVCGTVAAMIPAGAMTRFRRADAILVPVFATVFMALIDIAPALSVAKHAVLAVAIVFVTRELAGDPNCFAFAPLGLLLQAHFNSLHVRHLGWLPLLIAVATPLLLRLWSAAARRRFRFAIVWLIYPLVTLAFASATSKLAAEGKPHGDLFEDAHRFVPASEMLKGERPYVDIVPVHGFIEDGLLDYVTMRTGPVTEGRVAKVHGVLSAFNSLASYAIAAAATGSGDIGILSYFLAVAFALGGGPFRVTPALFALVFMVAAARKKRPRLLAYAGAFVVLATLTSFDFGAYAFIALVVTVVLMRNRRAVIDSGIGIAAAGVATLILLASFGCLTAYVRTTLFELLPVGTASATGMPPPLPLPFPDLLAGLFVRPDYALILLAIFIVCLATVKNRPILILASFVVAAGVYYAERRQFYFVFALAPLIATSIFVLFRRSRAAAIAAMIVVAIAAHVTGTLTTITLLRNARGPIDADVAEVNDVPRAEGALYRKQDAEIIEGVARYANERLGVDDTFFDFADAPNLYFLLKRDCPIRQIAVPFYEPEALQRDVVGRLARNPHVRAALVAADPNAGIDGVPNSARAPLVWQFLQANFAPDVRAGNVMIWRRVRF